jgi:hypothetical protein
MTPGQGKRIRKPKKSNCFQNIKMRDFKNSHMDLKYKIADRVNDSEKILHEISQSVSDNCNALPDTDYIDRKLTYLINVAKHIKGQLKEIKKENKKKVKL